MVDDNRRQISFEPAKNSFADFQKLEEEQIKLANKVIKQDAFSKLETIGGLDVVFHQDKIYCSAVVCNYKDMSILESQNAEKDCKIRYIPGFRAQREIDILVEAYHKLRQKPDVLLINASGTLHPRRCGLASHLGILLDQATIGITKNMLCGKLMGGTVVLDNETVGKEVIIDEKTKPIYVSVGHKVSLDKSVEIVKRCMLSRHSLPEPLLLAKQMLKKKTL
jgi:deoxyribonuclease V